MNWVKKKLRGWLFPEYQRYMLEVGKMQAFMDEISASREKIIHDSEKLTFKEPVIFLGSLHNCKVDMKPTLKPEIILSKLDLASLLEVSGSNQSVTGSYFRGELPETRSAAIRAGKKG